MNPQIIAAIVGAIIGGFLAGAAGLFVELRKGVIKDKRRLRLFSTAIIDDLKNSVLLYEKIQEDWTKSSLIWIVTITEWKKSRQTYERNNEHILLFNSPDLRQRISKYYLKSETLISSLEAMQNRKYAIDAKRRQNFSEIKLKDSSISDADANVKVDEVMKFEAGELKWITDSLPASIAKIDRLIGEAENLQQEISKIFHKKRCFGAIITGEYDI